MGKKVLIVSTSLRDKSNSETLAHEFERGAKDAGHDVEFLSLKGKKINFCVGCLTCGTRGRCFMDDDAIAIEEKFMAADVVVWATPIYYYAPSGSMKTLIDRLNPLYSKDYRFREVYVLSTAAENAETTPARVVSCVEGWIECLPKAQLKGSLFCGDVNDAGQIVGNPKLQEAYEMGKNV